MQPNWIFVEFLLGKDSLPYCERDYHKEFGVKCAYCDRYISGKVLQAGNYHHFHPTCARCTKCGDPFGDGEEMYLQGGAIWHPRCGPGPSEGGVTTGSSMFNGTNGHFTDGEIDRISNSAMSEMQVSNLLSHLWTIFRHTIATFHLNYSNFFPPHFDEVFRIFLVKSMPVFLSSKFQMCKIL